MEESCLFPISGMITLRENQDVCWQRRENGGPSLGRRSPGRTSPGRTSPGRTSPGRDNPERAIPEKTSPGRLGVGQVLEGISKLKTKAPTAAFILYDELRNLHGPQSLQNSATISVANLIYVPAAFFTPACVLIFSVFFKSYYKFKSLEFLSRAQKSFQPQDTIYHPMA